MQLLKNSRVDYIIGAFDAKQIGTEYKIQDIASFPLYHYINAKHSSIKKSLEEKLKKKITKALAKKLNEEAYLLLNIKLR